MEQVFPMQVVARIRSDFSSKFGVPRQSGLVDALEAAVVFEPEFRNPDAVRGLEGWGVTSAWGCLPPAPPSAQIPSAFPPCGWSGWS